VLETWWLRGRVHYLSTCNTKISLDNCGGATIGEVASGGCGVATIGEGERRSRGGIHSCRDL